MSRNPNREHTFRFKQFELSNSLSAMKINTDGVLLGAWTDATGRKSILDVGTGTGIIAIMLAQRNSDALITAIDIDEYSAKEAAINAGNCPWKKRIKVAHTDFKLLSTENKYDLIVSNPPYFDNGIKATDVSRATARHNDTLDYAELISLSSEMLTDSGALSLIAPYSRLEDIMYSAELAKLFVSHQTDVYNKPSGSAIRVMIELSKEPSPKITDSIAIYADNGGYTAEYVELTKDFYMNF